MRDLSNMSTELKHVAIIMDGNGRWAKQRSHKRTWGHIRGMQIISHIIDEGCQYHLEALTFYAFSKENWSRPLWEIKTLFDLLKKFLLIEMNRILKKNIYFKIIGDISKLPVDTQKIISSLENQTKNATGLILTFAFSYSGRNEIISALNLFIKDYPNTEISEKILTNYLDCPKIGDVDLLIRTGGNQRISNFLLWQMAYAEFYFTKTMWPSFSRKEFRSILEKVQLRERRFGNIIATDLLQSSVHQAQKNLTLIDHL